MSKLFSLFDDQLKKPDDLVVGDPQTLETIAQSVDDQELLLKKIRQFETVKPRVDFSDFSNFVFFNSALDYFNVTGELILNQYPYDGSRDQIEAFTDDLDDYQQYLVGQWPKASGHLRFDPSISNSTVQFNDSGYSDGETRTGLLSPGTGSWSVEFWTVPPPALTGSDDVMILLQKVTGSGDGYTAYFSGSEIRFRVVSGSANEEISVSSIPGQTSYFSFVLDRTQSEPVLFAMSGSTESFPVIVNSQSSEIVGNIDLGSSRFYIGSGSISSKVSCALSCSLDNVRLWNTALSLSDVSSSFNAKIFAQSNLVALWRFNETALTSSGQFTVPYEQNAIVLDHSGHRIHGVINNYQTSVRSSGSLVPFESPDPVISFDAAEVRSFIYEQQTSGSLYDKTNDNLITRLLPEQYFQLESYRETDVLEKFVYVLARQFDYMKIRIDQFSHVLKTGYGEYDQAPDALLSEVGKFFGWEFTGNFLNSSAFQYILGKNVLSGLESNKELDTKLYEIKNEFWRRTLINLMYLYKTKGTRESVESLLRIYGVNKNFVRLKEYGVKPNVGISTHRIQAEKSVAAIAIGSGSTTGSAYIRTPVIDGLYRTIETRIRFPTSISSNMQSSITTGSIWSFQASDGSELASLRYIKDSASSLTGTLSFSNPWSNLELTGANIFDSRWCNIVTFWDYHSSSLGLEVRCLDGNTIDKSLSVYGTSSDLPADDETVEAYLWLGATGSTPAQHWMQEVRIWENPLSEQERKDHVFNFQSFGADNISDLEDLSLHWRLAENVTASAAGVIINLIDVSGHERHGNGYGFLPSTQAYRKFLTEYNYIASPDFGWNEDKIRLIDSSHVNPRETFNDSPTLSLEFNMVDALNEDISQILSTMDGFNNSIGLPVNRYRDEYPDLEILRRKYFDRLNGKLNFRVFFDMMEFFDRSFVDMVRKLIPARAVFLGDEFVVESHMLERPKVRWNYRRHEKPFEPEGRITVFIR